MFPAIDPMSYEHFEFGLGVRGLTKSVAPRNLGSFCGKTPIECSWGQEVDLAGEPVDDAC
jgi:hypothetical protein